MTTEEKKQKLQSGVIVAYPTVATYDMGLQYEIISSEGLYTGMCSFMQWPLYCIKVDSQILRLVSILNQGKEISVDELNGSIFPIIKRQQTEAGELDEEYNEDELEAIKLFLHNIKKEQTDFYVFKQPYNDIELFDTKENAVQAFFLANNEDGEDWDDMDDSAIDYAYDNAEEYEWETPVCIWQEKE